MNLQQQITPIEEILFVLQEFLENKQLYESGTLDARIQDQIAQYLIEAQHDLIQQEIMDHEGKLIADPQQIVETRDILLNDLNQLRIRYDQLTNPSEEARNMRQMLNSIVPVDAQQEMLQYLEQGNFEPQIHNYIREELESVGIDCDHLIKTEPETYQMILKLYCSQTEEALVQA